jgi:hypothetical protein
MPLTMVVLGFGLVAVGVYFAVGGHGAANASGTALRGVSIQGPSWLILVALGVAVIMGGGYLYRDAQQQLEPTLVVEPWTYGDDADLDDLWDSCAEGDWSDCDELYAQSPADSGYEWFGGTCGGIADDPHAELCEPPTTTG